MLPFRFLIRITAFFLFQSFYIVLSHCCYFNCSIKYIFISPYSRYSFPLFRSFRIIILLMLYYLFFHCYLFPLLCSFRTCFTLLLLSFLHVFMLLFVFFTYFILLLIFYFIVILLDYVTNFFTLQNFVSQKTRGKFDYIGC